MRTDKLCIGTANHPSRRFPMHKTHACTPYMYTTTCMSPTPLYHPHPCTHTHTPPQSRKLQEAAKYLSELVGSYDPDKLYHACLKLAAVIKEGTKYTYIVQNDCYFLCGQKRTVVCYYTIIKIKIRKSTYDIIIQLHVVFGCTRHP